MTAALTLHDNEKCPLRAEVFAPRARSKLQAQGHTPFRAQTKRAASTEDDRSGRWAWTTWSDSTSSADHYIRYFSTPAADSKGWQHLSCRATVRDRDRPVSMPKPRLHHPPTPLVSRGRLH
nr:PREDICTED: uncharacterized protein LOC109037317 [Bemisia tabaci]